MRLITGIVALLLLAIALPSVAKEPIRTIVGIVTKVSDGDTLHVTDKFGTIVKVRMYGIDAPELRKGDRPGQQYGEESCEALRKKVQSQQVQLDVIDIDKYRRLVAVILIGNRNINHEMLAEGHAWAFRKYLGRDYFNDYTSLERQAALQRRGFWQQINPQPPWEFRHILKNNANR